MPFREYDTIHWCADRIFPPRATDFFYHMADCPDWSDFRSLRHISPAATAQHRVISPASIFACTYDYIIIAWDFSIIIIGHDIWRADIERQPRAGEQWQAFFISFSSVHIIYLWWVQPRDFERQARRRFFIFARWSSPKLRPSLIYAAISAIPPRKMKRLPPAFHAGSCFANVGRDFQPIGRYWRCVPYMMFLFFWSIFTDAHAFDFHGIWGLVAFVLWYQ